MFLYLLSVFAVCTCLIIATLLKYTSLKQLSTNQQEEHLSATDFLKLIKKAKVFPVGAQREWRIFTCQNSCRVWMRKILGKDDTTFLVFATVTKIPSSSQAVTLFLRDITKRSEWKPGIEKANNVGMERGQATGKRGSNWMDANVGHDVVVETIYDKTLAHGIQTLQRKFQRYWFREENGCSWLLESDSHEKTYYLSQPVEDLDSSLLTIVSHMTYPCSIQDNINKVSSLSFSVLDLFIQKKLKVTPLLDIRLPCKHSYYHYRDPELDNFSSSDEETERDIFSQKFSNLNPQEKNVILQKSESILKLSKPRARTISESNSRDLSGSDSCRPRARTHPQNGSVMLGKTHSEVDIEKEGSIHSVKSSMSNEKEMKTNAQEQNGSVSQTIKTSGKKREVIYTSFTDSDVSEFSSQDNREAEDLNKNDKELKGATVLNENTVKYTTLANQVAAELLALVIRVSNLDLRASTQHQQESTGGWMFCGLDSDVVIIKRHYHNINLCGSYIGKGIIQAPPQSVMDVVKNPRTRFTYDDSLKEVNVLEEISDKIKIVYYRHEVLHMFKKIEYDFTIIQSERSDGEKLVLSMETVDKGIPVPSGVNRVKMMTSGWIIEPITKDNKLFSMVTYVMQMNFGLCSQPAAEKSLIEEMVSKQPLSIAHLRQYLRPTFALSRQSSTASPSRSKKD